MTQFAPTATLGPMDAVLAHFADLSFNGDVKKIILYY